MNADWLVVKTRVIFIGYSAANAQVAFLLYTYEIVVFAADHTRYILNKITINYLVFNYFNLSLIINKDNSTV